MTTPEIAASLSDAQREALMRAAEYLEYTEASEEFGMAERAHSVIADIALAFGLDQYRFATAVRAELEKERG